MASSFKQTNGVGQIAPGAIVGSIEGPFQAVILFNVGSTLTTGDLSPNEPGDLSGAAEFAVEFWFLFTATQSSAVNIAQGPSSAGGKQWVVQLSTTGSINGVAIDDGGTARTATGATNITANEWHHIVLTAESGTLFVYVDGASYASTGTWGAHTIQTMAATAGQEDLRLTGPASAGNFYWDELAIYAKKLTAARVLAHYQAGRQRGFPLQSPAARLVANIDAVSSHVPVSFQTGSRNVIDRYMTGQSPLEEMRRAIEAEDVDAALFMTAGGTLKFLADGHRSSSPYNTSQATFGDGGGAELPYLDYKSDYSPSFLINEWNVTRTASFYLNASPVTQTASDSTSISRYFKRSVSLSDVPTNLDTNCATIATALLAKYKDPMYRVTEISPKMSDGETARVVYNRELMDRITVKRRPPGGGSVISQELFIQSITHSGTPGNPPSCTLGVSPL